MDGGKAVGAIIVHVDDFQIAGDHQNKKFLDSLEAIKTMYKWGKWVSDTEGYTVCGVRVQRTSGMGFRMDMADYCKMMHPMSISRDRRRQTTAKINGKEYGEVMAIIGQAQWLAGQVMPQVAALISKIQALLPTATVADLGY
eukprot:12046586-Alexandrium_andersonii.AAC.1